ncbi:hypothetical protein CYMTET_28181 [Cymbomonas tetramitiformis]|uniref:Uncharacterized protein n=1 Tax=Cymbomonas tetramitiformis TaxID=36881 RepID=A0AAE0FNM1_9CHLO|nr:hypothetical protein CYMTET_28181 [Cymbomonas tetramitiformis]
MLPRSLIGFPARALNEIRADHLAAIYAGDDWMLFDFWFRHWWPLLLCPDGVHFASFVVDWKELPTDSVEPLFRPVAGRTNEVAAGPPSFRVPTLNIDGCRERDV